MNIADQLQIHAQQELQHALTISRQIDYLGKMPSVKPKPVKISDKPREMLQFDPTTRTRRSVTIGLASVVDRGHKIVAVVPVGTGSSTQIEERDGRPGAGHFTVGTAEIRQIQMVSAGARIRRGGGRRDGSPDKGSPHHFPETRGPSSDRRSRSKHLRITQGYLWQPEPNHWAAALPGWPTLGLPRGSPAG